jgi:hypothetical protein
MHAANIDNQVPYSGVEIALEHLHQEEKDVSLVMVNPPIILSL